MSQTWPERVVAPSRQCRRHRRQYRCAHASTGRPCHAPRSLYKIVSQHKLPVARRVAWRWAPYRSPDYSVLRPRVAPQPRYKFVSRLPLARPCSARCRMPRAQVGRVVAYIVALPRRVVVVAWPYRGHALAAPRPASLALCHDTKIVS